MKSFGLVLAAINSWRALLIPSTSSYNNGRWGASKGSLWLSFVILQMFYMHQKGRNTLMERGKPQKAQYGLFMVTPYVIKIESTFWKGEAFQSF